MTNIQNHHLKFTHSVRQKSVLIFRFAKVYNLTNYFHKLSLGGAAGGFEFQAVANQVQLVIKNVNSVVVQVQNLIILFLSSNYHFLITLNLKVIFA